MPGFLIFLSVFGWFSSPAWSMDCLQGLSGKSVPLNGIVASIEKGATLFLGELHGLEPVAEGQVQILEELRRQGHHVDIGFEFYAYPKQPLVQEFQRGNLTEAEFLKSIEWASAMDFSFYRRQTLFPKWSEGEFVWALNAPRSLTGAIAKRGIESLSEEERQLLPPDLHLGRAEYFERFRQLMGGHVDETKLSRYFEAQSVWDDTMAWQLTTHQTGHTQVVVVGEFHVRYGGGLPDRLLARSSQSKVVTLGFVNIQDLSAEEIQEEIRPHQSWGAREDYICLIKAPIPKN
jgi:uncharacterized iron-regulated protein